MTAGYSTLWTHSRIVTANPIEHEVLIVPNDRSHIGRPPVIFCHGYNGKTQDGVDWTSSPGGAAPFLRLLALSGLLCLSFDLGGKATFGNDLSMTRIGQARTFLTAQGCASDRVLFLADSMGFWLASRYAMDNPGVVPAILAIEPGIDLNGVRDNNVLNARNDINTAWGLAAGSTSATVPIPARSNVLARTAAGELNGVHLRAYYSTADIVAQPAHVLSLVGNVGATAEAIPVAGTPAHGAGVSAAVPKPEAVGWLASFAA